MCLNVSLRWICTCKGDNIYHIWLCWIRPHGTSGCTSYSPLNVSLMVGPEFAPLKASTMRILFRPFEIPTALSHRPKRPTQPETENTLNHSPLLPSKANVLTDRVLPIVENFIQATNCCQGELLQCQLCSWSHIPMKSNRILTYWNSISQWWWRMEVWSIIVTWNDFHSPPFPIISLKSALFFLALSSLHMARMMAGGQLWYWDEWERAVARREPLGHEQPGRYDRTNNEKRVWVFMDIWRETLVMCLPSFPFSSCSLNSPNILRTIRTWLPNHTVQTS